jgi:hypothetical protein
MVINCFSLTYKGSFLFASTNSKPSNTSINNGSVTCTITDSWGNVNFTEWNVGADSTGILYNTSLSGGLSYGLTNKNSNLQAAYPSYIASSSLAYTIYNSVTVLNGEYIQYSMSSSVSIDSYTLGVYSGWINYFPGKWVLLGSTDSNTWKIINQYTNASNLNLVTNTISAVSYPYYRLVITQLNSNVASPTDYSNMILNLFSLSYNGSLLFASSNSKPTNTSINNGTVTCTITDSWGNVNFTEWNVGAASTGILYNTGLDGGLSYGLSNKNSNLQAAYPSYVAGSSSHITLIK